ncbi:MAG: hypothetical protein D6800_07810, partial [Candidatus Zixiibacteriota bacterium]
MDEEGFLSDEITTRSNDESAGDAPMPGAVTEDTLFVTYLRSEELARLSAVNEALNGLRANPLNFEQFCGAVFIGCAGQLLGSKFAEEFQSIRPDVADRRFDRILGVMGKILAPVKEQQRQKDPKGHSFASQFLRAMGNRVKSGSGDAPIDSRDIQNALERGWHSLPDDVQQQAAMLVQQHGPTAGQFMHLAAKSDNYCDVVGLQRDTVPWHAFRATVFASCAVTGAVMGGVVVPAAILAGYHGLQAMLTSKTVSELVMERADFTIAI